MIVLHKSTPEGTLYWKVYLSTHDPRFLMVSSGFLGTTLRTKSIACLDKQDAYVELKQRATEMEERGYIL